MRISVVARRSEAAALHDSCRLESLVFFSWQALAWEAVQLA